MTLETAREVTGRLWCDPEYHHVELDAHFAEAIAILLWRYANEPAPEPHVSAYPLCERPAPATDPQPDAPVIALSNTTPEANALNATIERIVYKINSELDWASGDETPWATGYVSALWVIKKVVNNG